MSNVITPTFQSLPKELTYYGSVDFAISEATTADYTVVIAAGLDTDGNLFVRQPYRARTAADGIIEAIIRNMKTYHPSRFAIENVHISKTLGPLLTTRMRAEGLFVHLEPMTPHKDKIARASTLQGMLQHGKVFFEDSPFTHDIIIPELLSFPAGRNDDVVDALAQLCQMVDMFRRPYIATPPVDNSWPEGSYGWMRQRTADARGENALARHRPPPLRGRPKPRDPWGR